MMDDIVCILSNATTGVKCNSKKKREPLNVCKGELVVEIPKKDQIAQREGLPSHNYRLLRNPNVSFYDSGINIIPLQGPEADYLEGIADQTARILEYRKKQRLRWIMNLRSGDMVFFRLERGKGLGKGSKVPIHTKGMIRYFGAVEGRNGVTFGIEIMDPEHKGKGNTNGHPYFKCNHNDGAFVSMYEIITTAEEPSSERTDPEKKPITRKQTESPPAILYNTPRSKMSVAQEKAGGWVNKAYSYISGGEGGDNQDEPHKLVPIIGSSDTFSLNDGVVVQNVKGKAITGAVRWVGQMTAASKVVVPVVIGIETDRPVDLKKEFPDTHLGMTGSHGQQLFDLERGKNHGKLFLPEPLVLHVEQYAKQKQEEGTFDAKEAKKWGMSLDEYREQMQKIAETETKKRKESQIKGNKLKKTSVLDPLYQQRQEELERQRRACELENTPEDDKIESHVGHHTPVKQIKKKGRGILHGIITQLKGRHVSIISLINTIDYSNEEGSFVISQLKQAVIAKKEIFKKLKEDEEKFDNQIAESSQRLSLLFNEQELLLHKERRKNQQLSEHIDELQQEHQTELEEMRCEKIQLEHEHQRELERMDQTYQMEVVGMSFEKNKIKEDHKKEVEEMARNNTEQLQQQEHEHRRELEKLTREKVQLEEFGKQFEESWKFSHKDITMTTDKLGGGAWGAVIVGVFREKRVAVKQLHDLIMSEANLAVMNREVNTMSRLRHPNLLLFIGAVLDHPSGNPLIITEIMDTSLRSAYEKGQITGESVKLSILRDTASALNYLHYHPAGAIIHRDVSSANVLLETRDTNQWRAKLSDFGSANEVRKANTQAPGAQVYAAPESFVSVMSKKKAPQTTKMDVFSFGVLTCEVMVCQFPDHEKFERFFRAISVSSPSMHRLISECISEDPNNRPTMKIIIGRINVQLI